MRAVRLDHVGALVAAERLQHAEDALLRAAAEGLQRPGREEPHALLVEEPVEQRLGRQRSDRSARPRRRSRTGTAPRARPRRSAPRASSSAMFCSSTPPARHFGPVAGVGLADRQPHPRRRLLGLGEVELGAQRQRLALDRRDALVALDVRALVDGHDEDALAQQRLGARRRRSRAGRPRPAARRRSGSSRAAPPRCRSRRPRRRPGPSPWACTISRPSNFRLAPTRAASAQVSPSRLATGRRIVVAGEDLVDGGAQAHEAAAHRLALDLERGDEIVEGEGSLGTTADMGADPPRLPRARSAATAAAQIASKHQARIDFWAWMRFSASSQTTELRAVDDARRSPPRRGGRAGSAGRRRPARPGAISGCVDLVGLQRRQPRLARRCRPSRPRCRRSRSRRRRPPRAGSSVTSMRPCCSAARARSTRSGA